MTRRSETRCERDGASSNARARLLSGLPVVERQYELAGIPTALLQGGEGPPMVLLHGAGEFAATWMRVLPALVATHQVIAPDLPGHGASGVPDGPLDANRVLAWLDELIRRTCSSPPVIVGHLLGGAIALRFALEHGTRIRRLVLVDAFGLARLRPSPRFTFALVRFIIRPNERSQDRLFRQCMVDVDEVRVQVGERWDLMSAYALERSHSREQSAAVRCLIHDFGSRMAPNDLAGITTPTSLIWGRHDRQVRLRVGQVASTRHGWPLHVIDGAADDPAAELPETFLRVLHAALARS